MLVTSSKSSRTYTTDSHIRLGPLGTWKHDSFILCHLRLPSHLHLAVHHYYATRSLFEMWKESFGRLTELLRVWWSYRSVLCKPSSLVMHCPLLYIYPTRSRDCQVAHWKVHKPVCKPLEDNQVLGIKVLDNRYQPWSTQFQHVLLDTSHTIFTQGEMCLLTEQCGLPLMIYSDSIHGGLPAYADNQPAVYLRIEAHDGFAPVQYVLTISCMSLVTYFFTIVGRSINPER